MRKKFLGMIIVAIIVFAAGYNVYVSHNNVKLSALALSNVEALASSNEWEGNDCFWVDSDYLFCTPWGAKLGCPCYS